MSGSSWSWLRVIVISGMIGVVLNITLTWAIAAVLPVGLGAMPSSSSAMWSSRRIGPPDMILHARTQVGCDEIEANWVLFVSKTTGRFMVHGEHRRKQREWQIEYNQLHQAMRRAERCDDPCQLRQDELLAMMQDWTPIIVSLRERHYGLPFRSALVLDPPFAARRLFANTLSGDLVPGIPNPLSGLWTLATVRLPTFPLWAGLLGNSALFGFATFCVFFVGRSIKRRWYQHAGRCVACGYTMCGLVQCPECGGHRELARKTPPRSTSA